MNIFGDGNRTADPAIWGDWIGCVNEVTHTEHADTLTVLKNIFRASGKIFRTIYSI